MSTDAMRMASCFRRGRCKTKTLSRARSPLGKTLRRADELAFDEGAALGELARAQGGANSRVGIPLEDGRRIIFRSIQWLIAKLVRLRGVVERAGVVGNPVHDRIAQVGLSHADGHKLRQIAWAEPDGQSPPIN